LEGEKETRITENEIKILERNVDVQRNNFSRKITIGEKRGSKARKKCAAKRIQKEGIEGPRTLLVYYEAYNPTCMHI
jgi:hypothetical protein